MTDSQGSMENTSGAHSMNANALRYEDVVAVYTIDVSGGDLQLTPSGDIAVTNDGDLKWGNDRVNAMHRLVQRWCFNAPTLEGLFKLVADADEKGQQLSDEKDMIAPIAFRDPKTTERFHDITNEQGACAFGAAACAGAIMVVLNNLLMRLQVDLNAPKGKWEKCSPQIGGCSLGSIVAAAAANFRHHDEWARVNPPSEQQLRSIEVISAALGQTIATDCNRHPFRQNVCPQLLEVVSGGDFEQLGQRLFQFAKDLAA